MPETGRRGFIYTVMAVVGGLFAAWYLFLAERFMLPPEQVAGTWQKVGVSADFPLNQPQIVVYTGDGGFPDGVWIVRLQAGLVAYDCHCAHLQCTVVYVEGSYTPGSTTPATFDCPCHGSVYTVTTNRVIGGPAPHGLNYHKIRETNGVVEVGEFIPWADRKLVKV